MSILTSLLLDRAAIRCQGLAKQDVLGKVDTCFCSTRWSPRALWQYIEVRQPIFQGRPGKSSLRYSFSLFCMSFLVPLYMISTFREWQEREMLWFFFGLVWIGFIFFCVLFSQQVFTFSLFQCISYQYYNCTLGLWGQLASTYQNSAVRSIFVTLAYKHAVSKSVRVAREGR